GRARPRTRDLAVRRIAPRARRRRVARLQHELPVRPARQPRRALSEDPSLRRGAHRARLGPRVGDARPRRRGRDRADRARRARALGVLRSSFPRALPPARSLRPPGAARPDRLHVSDRSGALGGAVPGPGDREPVLPDRARPGRHEPPWLRPLGRLAGRRPLGPGGRARRRRRADRHRRDRPRLPRPGAPGAAMSRARADRGLKFFFQAVTPDEARAALVTFPALGTEHAPVAAAAGRVLATDVAPPGAAPAAPSPRTPPPPAPCRPSTGPTWTATRCARPIRSARRRPCRRISGS